MPSMDAPRRRTSPARLAAACALAAGLSLAALPSGAIAVTATGYPDAADVAVILAPAWTSAAAARGRSDASGTDSDAAATAKASDTDYYTDEDGSWAEDTARMNQAMGSFYDEVGVRPYLYVLKDGSVTSTTDLKERSDELYQELFDGEDRFLLVFCDTGAGHFKCAYTIGAQARDAMDDDAVNVLAGKLRDAYKDLDAGDRSSFFPDAFSSAGQAIADAKSAEAEEEKRRQEEEAEKQRQEEEEAKAEQERQREEQQRQEQEARARREAEMKASGDAFAAWLDTAAPAIGVIAAVAVAVAFIVWKAADRRERLAEVLRTTFKKLGPASDDEIDELASKYEGEAGHGKHAKKHDGKNDD